MMVLHIGCEDCEEHGDIRYRKEVSYTTAYHGYRLGISEKEKEGEKNYRSSCVFAIVSKMLYKRV